MTSGFTAACTALNISVVASAGMDSLAQLTPTQQANAQARFAEEVQTQFTQANVKVYLLAFDDTDVFSAGAILYSIGVLAEGHTVLLPSQLISGSSRNPQNICELAVIQDGLAGSIGIYPVSDPVATAEMWAAWPKNAANWSALLATQQQRVNVTNLAPPDPVYMSLGAHDAWDGTLFLAKAIAAALVECELMPPFYDRPELKCLVNVIRNTTMNGTNGPIILDSNGDRTGQFGVFNIVNRRRVQIGTVDAPHGVADVGVDQIVWSDGTSNRDAAPAWGQEPHPPTPAPTGVPGESSVSESEKALYSVIGLSVLLLLSLLIIVFRKHRRKAKKMRPTDFRKVLTHVTWLTASLMYCTHCNAVSSSVDRLLCSRVQVIARLQEQVRVLNFGTPADGEVREVVNVRLEKQISVALTRTPSVQPNSLGVPNAQLKQRGVTPADGESGDEVVDTRLATQISATLTRLSSVQFNCLSVPNELNRRGVIVENELGAGQFGKIYQGRLTVEHGHAHTQIAVAIKTVVSAADNVAFSEEAVVTWQFQHPNVVGMFGVVTSGTPHLLVLELCVNGELLKFVQTETANHSTELLVGILKDAAAGMRYLTTKHFVHRDVAARNVLLGDEHRAKIADFGLSRGCNNASDDYYRCVVACSLFACI
jgi:hypothetical protein